MNIILIGPHGVGKSTVGKRLAKALGIPFHHELGREDHAADVYSAAYSALAKLGDRRFQALILARIGALAADKGDLQQAATSFKRAKDLVSKVQDPRGGQAVHVHSAHVLVALYKQSRDKRHSDKKKSPYRHVRTSCVLTMRNGAHCTG